MTRTGIRLAIFLLVLSFLAGCAPEGPEARLRSALDDLGQGIESRDARAVEGVLAEDFIGPDAMDREAARQLAALMFLRYRDVGVTTGPPRIEVSGTHATVEFQALLTGGSGRLLPDSARAYQVKSGWALEDGEWKMRSVDWSAGG